jgi:hypothetical protein
MSLTKVGWRCLRCGGSGEAAMHGVVEPGPGDLIREATEAHQWDHPGCEASLRPEDAKIQVLAWREVVISI